MADEPENSTVSLLRQMDGKLDDILEGTSDLKVQMDSLIRRMAVMGADVSVQARVDRVEHRLDRIERRLDLVETPVGMR